MDQQLPTNVDDSRPVLTTEDPTPRRNCMPVETPRATRIALQELATYIENLDKQTHELQNQLEDLLRPQDPQPDCPKEDKKAAPNSAITNNLYHLANNVSTITTRIDSILGRLEI